MYENFVAKTITEKLRRSYEQQFTGFYRITSHSNQQWYIYFLLGRIVWAQPSKYPFRVWHRHLTIHSPALSKQIGNPISLYYEYWNYTALSRLVKLKQFPRVPFSQIVESCVAEALFDVLQAGTWQYDDFGDLCIDVLAREAGNMPFVMLETLQPWKKAQQSWQHWQKAGFEKISPNWSLTITDVDALKEQTPLQTFQTLSSFANGEHALRDLAVKVKQPIIPIARSVRPYIAKKLLSFTEIPDIIENAHQGFPLELLENGRASSERLESESSDTDQPIEQASSEVDTAELEKTEEKISILKVSESVISNNTEKVADVSNSKEQVIVEQVPTTHLIEEKMSAATGSKAHTLTEASSLIDESVVTLSATRYPVEEKSAERVVEQSGLTSSPILDQKAPISKAASVLTQSQLIDQSKQPQSEQSQPIPGNQLNTDSRQVRKNKDRKRKSRKSKLPKIVYVDDSPADSRTMAAIVEKMGYQYTNIPDPLQALPILIELRPKLIFLDLVMPVANGYEICAQIRRITSFKKIPIVIVTSNDGIADRVRAKIVGASGFMGKPIKEKKVQKVLKKHLSYVVNNK